MFSSSCDNVTSLFPQFCNPNEAMNTTTTNDCNNHTNMLVFESSSSSTSNQTPLTVSFWPTNGYNCDVPILNVTQQQPQPPQTNQVALNENDINAIPPVFRQPKGPVKRKDRHSKISTAQGVRDRRVRLSIEIARKFFDLQDLLGFDRASKTLEWLLLKSKKAIKELSTHSNSNNNANANTNKPSLTSSNSTCDQVDHHQHQDHDLVVYNNNDKIVVVESLVDSKREKKLEKTPVVGKQSRAKARARARERTKMKMSIRALHDSFKKTCSVPTLIPILNHSRSVAATDLKAPIQENGPNNSSTYNYQVSEQRQQQLTTRSEQQQQSLELKTKSKSNLMIGYHHNLVPSCNNNQPQNPS